MSPEPTTPPDDFTSLWAAWVEARRAGRPFPLDGERHLFNTLSPWIQMVARRHAIGEQDVEDVVQEVMLSLCRIPTREVKDQRDIVAFAAEIANRRAADVFRQKRRTPKSVGAGPGDDPSSPLDLIPDPGLPPPEMAVAWENREAMGNALGRLPAQDRLICTMMYFHRVGISAIEARTGLTNNQVRTRLARIRDELRIELADDRETPPSGALG